MFFIQFKSQPDSRFAKTHLHEGIHSTLGDRCPLTDIEANISTLVAGTGRGPAGSDLGIESFQRPRSGRFGGISAPLVSEYKKEIPIEMLEESFNLWTGRRME